MYFSFLRASSGLVDGNQLYLSNVKWGVSGWPGLGRAFFRVNSFGGGQAWCISNVGSFVLVIVTVIYTISLRTRDGSFCSFAIEAVSNGRFPLSSLGKGGILMIGMTSGYKLAPRCTGLRRLCRGCGSGGFIVVNFPTGGFVKRRPKDGRRVTGFYSLGCSIAFPVVSGVSIGNGSVTPLCR